MTQFSLAELFGMKVRESANDGSDFSNPAADFRVLFLGEDGTLYVKDSAGTVTHPYTGGGGGGSLVWLQRQTAASSASLNFTGFISSTYEEYVFELSGVIPATTNVDFFVRVSTDGGSTWVSSSSYATSIWGHAPAGTVNTGSTSTTQIMLRNTGEIVNTSTKGVSGTLRLFYPASTALHKRFVGQFSYMAGQLVNINLSAEYQATTAVNGVQFFFSSGNITSGNIDVYGLTHA